MEGRDILSLSSCRNFQMASAFYFSHTCTTFTYRGCHTLPLLGSAECLTGFKTKC